MKTTLNLNDALLAQARVLAAQQGTTLTRLIEDGLQLRLRQQQTPARSLLVHQGKGGLASGLDGLSNKAMLEAASLRMMQEVAS
jgi:hypothetical protein